MLVVCYQCARPRNIGNIISFLGVPGDHTFHNIVCKNMETFTNKMHTELHEIINKGFDNEIKASIKHELKGEYSYDEIAKYTEIYN